MSWQDYVDIKLLGTKRITDACIAGHDANIWALSRYFEVTKLELTKLISGIDHQEVLAAKGVVLAGKKYVYLSGTDNVVRAKSNWNGVHCMKTGRTVIVATYRYPVQLAVAATIVEDLGDFLISRNF